MKKIVIVMLVLLSTLYGWEINTHRAIDKTAINNGTTSNLNTFLEDSHLKEYSSLPNCVWECIYNP